MIWLPIGLAIGAVISWAVLNLPEESAEPVINIGLNLFYVMVLALAVMLLFVAVISWWIVRRVISPALATLDQIVVELTAASLALEKNDNAAAISHAGEAVREGVGWYTVVSTRRLAAATALALLVALGGLVGTALLFRQTLYLKVQNKAIDLQTVTSEAQRRGGLLPELFAILQDPSLTETPDKSEGAAADQKRAKQRALVSRIITFIQAATPYWTIESAQEGEAGPRRADRLRSPERGHLLVGLLFAGFKFEALDQEALERMSFEYADLREKRLPPAQLRRVQLSRADLKKANLTSPGIDLSEATLSHADLSAAQFRETRMEHTFLDDAKLESASFLHTKMKGALLNRADLTSAKFEGARLEGASLVGAKLIKARIFETSLKGADLRNSDFTDATLIASDLENAIVGKGNPAAENLPSGFPRGWSSAPSGWEIYADHDLQRLRRK